MRTRFRVAQERADLIGGFGGQNVLELAGLLFDLGFTVHGQRVGKQALGEAVAANDVGGALVAAGSQFDDHRAVSRRESRRFERVVTGINERLVVMRLGRMGVGRDQSHGRHLFDGD